MHNPDAGTALTRNVSCSRCHSTQGTDYHQTFNTDHTYSAMDASCQGSNCHSNALVTAHEAYVGTGNRYPEYSDTCALCHLNESPTRIPANATAACSSCHTIHADLGAAHMSTGGADNVSIGMNNDYHSTGDMGYFNCSDCHITNLLSLHVNNCGACHASSNPNVNGAVSNGQHLMHRVSPDAALRRNRRSLRRVRRRQLQLRLVPRQRMQHLPRPAHAEPRPEHDDGLEAGVRGQRHDQPDPERRRDRRVRDQGDVLHRRRRSDPDRQDRLGRGTGLGTASHTLQYWSTDWSGNTEAKKSGSFTVSKDIVPPTTTSDVKASYIGPVTIKLTATDGSQAGVAHTYYSIDGGAAAEGLTVNLAQPASGTASHTHELLVDRCLREPRTPKSASFTVTADLVAPTTVMTSSSYYRNTWTSFNFTSTDPAPELGPRELLRPAGRSADQHLRALRYGNGNWAITCYIPTGGTHTLSFWAKDKSGNTETCEDGDHHLRRNSADDDRQRGERPMSARPTSP